MQPLRSFSIALIIVRRVGLVAKFEAAARRVRGSVEAVVVGYMTGMSVAENF